MADYCKAYPDEKGIETERSQTIRKGTSWIAKPIPMKRELKQYDELWARFIKPKDCKAYPDEKGIETWPGGWREKERVIGLQSLSR